MSERPATGPLPATGAPLTIGAKRPGAPRGDQLAGALADVRVYPRALDPLQVADLYLLSACRGAA